MVCGENETSINVTIPVVMIPQSAGKKLKNFLHHGANGKLFLNCCSFFFVKCSMIFPLLCRLVGSVHCLLLPPSQKGCNSRFGQCQIILSLIKFIENINMSESN